VVGKTAVACDMTYFLRFRCSNRLNRATSFIQWLLTGSLANVRLVTGRLTERKSLQFTNRAWMKICVRRTAPMLLPGEGAVGSYILYWAGCSASC
jgi:hypothetical protein